MPDVPERKVGIIACCGEELAVGTASRLAALKVLHHARPGKTVTICLPLFLAGGEGIGRLPGFTQRLPWTVANYAAPREGRRCIRGNRLQASS